MYGQSSQYSFILGKDEFAKHVDQVLVIESILLTLLGSGGQTLDKQMTITQTKTAADWSLVISYCV